MNNNGIGMYLSVNNPITAMNKNVFEFKIFEDPH